MKVFLLLLCILTVDSRTARYKPLVCDNMVDYKVCEIERGGDYTVVGYKGEISIYCDQESQMFFYNDKQYALSMGNKLYVPTFEWDLTRWVKFMDGLRRDKVKLHLDKLTI